LRWRNGAVSSDFCGSGAIKNGTIRVGKIKDSGQATPRRFDGNLRLMVVYVLTMSATSNGKDGTLPHF
jgi:hypothetical protein